MGRFGKVARGQRWPQTQLVYERSRIFTRRLSTGVRAWPGIKTAMCSVGTFFATGAFAITPTPAQKSACMSDVMSLCMHAVPSNDRIYACLVANKARLSPPCRAQFEKKE